MTRSRGPARCGRPRLLRGEFEWLLLCPANHSPPMLVAPHPGAPGYESVATCLATPAVRARTEGLVAIRRAG